MVLFAPLTIRRINNLRAVNTLNSSTPVASTSITFVINNLRTFLQVPGRLPQLCSTSAVSAGVLLFRTIQCYLVCLRTMARSLGRSSIVPRISLRNALV